MVRTVDAEPVVAPGPRVSHERACGSVTTRRRCLEDLFARLTVVGVALVLGSPGAGFAAAAPSSAPTGAVLRIGGGAAPIENVFKRVKAPFERATGIRLELLASGPDQALADLDAGKLDIASAGLAMPDWLDLMRQRKLALRDAQQLQDRVIGRDEIRVILHPSLQSIAALNQAQLRDVFTGRVYNWRQVGGPDIDIVVIYGTRIPGTNKLWQEQILGGAPWTLARREAGDTAAIKAAVASTPGAVSIGPMSSDDSRALYSPATPQVSRPITAVTRGEPSAAAQRLFEFLQGEGARYIAR